MIATVIKQTPQSLSEPICYGAIFAVSQKSHDYEVLQTILNATKSQTCGHMMGANIGTSKEDHK